MGNNNSKKKDGGGKNNYSAGSGYRSAYDRRQGRAKLAFRVIAIILAVLMVITFVLMLSSCGGARSAEAFKPDSKEFITVEIPSGSTAVAIGQILEDNGIIESAKAFKSTAKATGYDSRFQAGVYTLSPAMSTNQIMETLVGGKVDTMRFTVNEGLTVAETARKLEADGIVSYDAFMYEAEHGEFDYKFMPFLPAGPERLEGFLYPDTYDMFTTADEHDIIDRMLAEFDKVYKDEYYARATELGMDLNDIVTIASMIEGETKVIDERPLVSSVIYNRLGIGMPLQIDATVIYAMGEHKEHLTYDDLEIDSPYNTYKVTGLPVGPICSPSVTSIEAALYPAETDYFYYVLSAELNGTHKFASNAAEFQQYKKEYKAAIKNK